MYANWTSTHNVTEDGLLAMPPMWNEDEWWETNDSKGNSTDKWVPTKNSTHHMWGNKTSTDNWWGPKNYSKKTVRKAGKEYSKQVKDMVEVWMEYFDYLPEVEESLEVLTSTWNSDKKVKLDNCVPETCGKKKVDSCCARVSSMTWGMKGVSFTQCVPESVLAYSTGEWIEDDYYEMACEDKPDSWLDSSKTLAVGLALSLVGATLL